MTDNTTTESIPDLKTMCDNWMASTNYIHEIMKSETSETIKNILDVPLFSNQLIDLIAKKTTNYIMKELCDIVTPIPELEIGTNKYNIINNEKLINIYYNEI